MLHECLNIRKAILLVFTFSVFGVPFISVLSMHAENYFRIHHFSKDYYRGGQQNWDISLDGKGKVFIANNSGLIIMSSSGTELHSLPQQTIIRSVLWSQDRIYTGSFEEFGFWEVQAAGEAVYHSLVPTDGSLVMHNDEFWKIVAHKEKIYFQSFGKILCYDGHQIIPIELPGSVLFLLEADGRLFVQEINGGLFELDQDKLVKLPGSEIFANTEVKTILPYDDESFLIGTSSRGLYLYSSIGFRPWPTDADQQLMASKINHGTRLGDQFVFGTLLKGLFIIDRQGKLKQHLHSGNGLQNNTILALETDQEENLWVGMDKGYDFVWFNAPILLQPDHERQLGTVYTAATWNEYLYVGTNQGIYRYDFGFGRPGREAEFINGSEGQVWFLKVIDGELFAGLNHGTFRINGNELDKISNVSGGYNLSKATVNEQEILLQSTYSSVVVFKPSKNTWKISHSLEGFMAPARFVELDFLGNLLLGHSISGIYLIQPNAGFDSVSWYKKLGVEHGLTFPSDKVFRVDNRLLVSSPDGFMQWDAINARMVLYDELNAQLEEFALSKNVLPAGLDKYWFVRDTEIAMFEIRFGKAKLLYRLIPQLLGLNLVENHENIIQLNDSVYFFCQENGFGLLNMQRLHRLSGNNQPPLIEIARISKNDGTYKNLLIPENISVGNAYNNLEIAFSSNGNPGIASYYQYKLEGIDLEWSDWTTSGKTVYNRLPPGTYTFKARYLTTKGMVTTETGLSFRILKPWYLSVYALFTDALLLLLLVMLIRSSYKRRKWKLHEKQLREENERMRQLNEQAKAEIVQLTNQKLQTEIDSKNVELAKNTMAILRKNELLIELKSELDKQKEELGYRLPVRYYENLNKILDHGISSDHEWEMFEHLFDQAHQNFFKRLKNDYPDLTPSELRLCAYLKLNLSSKEIAPLLNITIRGVEEKRYRLRKKLNLSSEQGLTDFIMAF
jgi:DNA-binding CsgD family transcriptional regulator